MSFIEIQFPTNLSYNSQGGPGFSTSIIQSDSGKEFRIARWNNALRKYNAAYAIREYDDLSTLIDFYMAVQGALNGFRYKDWTDYTSASNHRDDAAYDDQVIGTGDGTETQFQLMKTYTYGSTDRTRNIEKPVSGTVLVGVNGTPTTSGWTVDTTTGIITFSVAPTYGHSITAGFDFNVPVRFGESLDEALSIDIENWGSGSVHDVPLIEIRDELQSYNDFFFGGGVELALTADKTLSLGEARVYSFIPDTNGHDVFTPDINLIPTGGPIFIIENQSATYTFTIKDTDGNTLATAGTSSVTYLFSVKTSTGRDWITG